MKITTKQIKSSAAHCQAPRAEGLQEEAQCVKPSEHHYFGGWDVTLANPSLPVLLRLAHWGPPCLAMVLPRGEASLLGLHPQAALTFLALPSLPWGRIPSALRAALLGSVGCSVGRHWPPCLTQLPRMAFQALTREGSVHESSPAVTAILPSLSEASPPSAHVFILTVKRSSSDPASGGLSSSANAHPPRPSALAPRPSHSACHSAVELSGQARTFLFTLRYNVGLR